MAHHRGRNLAIPNPCAMPIPSINRVVPMYPLSFFGIIHTYLDNVIGILPIAFLLGACVDRLRFPHDDMCSPFKQLLRRQRSFYRAHGRCKCQSNDNPNERNVTVDILFHVYIFLS